MLLICRFITNMPVGFAVIFSRVKVSQSCIKNCLFLAVTYKKCFTYSYEIHQYCLPNNYSFSYAMASDLYFIVETFWFTVHRNLLGPFYTWRTLTGVKLNNNWTQYSMPASFLAT